jgi:hypothetical protein
LQFKKKEKEKGKSGLQPRVKHKWKITSQPEFSFEILMKSVRVPDQ